MDSRLDTWNRSSRAVTARTRYVVLSVAGALLLPSVEFRDWLWPVPCRSDCCDGQPLASCGTPLEIKLTGAEFAQPQ